MGMSGLPRCTSGDNRDEGVGNTEMSISVIVRFKEKNSLFKLLHINNITDD